MKLHCMGWLLTGILLLPTAAVATPRVDLAPAAAVRATPGPAPMIGVSWYPEQWPESGWDADLSLMERADIKFVRIGEFAWSSIEPHEGEYRLDWLNHAIRAAERHHIYVVLGTPTAAPPVWLTSHYPDVLRTLPDGSRAIHGGRHQADFASAKFEKLAREVVARLAERFGRDRNVIGWQIDNEIGTDDHSTDTLEQFRTWLRSRYKSLSVLNAAWSTAYWSQTYQDWPQIPFPERLDSNPGLMLDWRLFIADRYRGYISAQLDELRPRIDPRQKVTTNYWIDARAKDAGSLSPDQDDLDLYTTSRDLDFVSWDEYVGSGHLDPVRFGAAHDLVRGLLHKNFWVMETQPGAVNWSASNNALDKAELRALAWHAVGHGADAVGYWQWRSAPNGQEQYHGTLVGADGRPVPAYDEIRKIGLDFAKAVPALDGTTVRADVALFNDYPSRWAIGWQRFAHGFSYADSLVDYYAPLHAIARSVDIVEDTAPLDDYRLVVAPALNVLTAEAAKHLAEYVRSGGNLVLGARSGLKDGDNALWQQRQPGPLAALLGAHVAQWYALEKPVAVGGDWGKGQASMWAERIDITDPKTHVMLRYGDENSWLAGQPAAVTRRVGRGSITYIGASLDSALTGAIVHRLASADGVAAVLPDLPENIDVAVRRGNGKRVFILTNYGPDAQRVVLPSPMHDVLADQRVRDVTLDRYGVAVLESTDSGER